MKRLTVSGEKWGTTVEEEVVRVLQQGGIVLHPTETCYGLAVDIFNQEALQKLYRIKKMSNFKPVSIIVSSIADAKCWAEINDYSEELMEKYWPGPYTFVVKRKGTLPKFFNISKDKVGLRNPSVESLLNIEKKLGHPVTTTSANISGRSETYDINDFFTQLNAENILVQPDLIIDGGTLEKNPPSTVYDCEDDVLIRGEIDL